MGVTSIQWTAVPRADGSFAPGYTFNPFIGCAKVSPGCESCYAWADMDLRRHRVEWGPRGTRSVTSEAYWRQPLAWDRAAREAGGRRRVFCASLADWLEDWRGPIVDAHNAVVHVAESGLWTGGGSALIGSRPLTMTDVRGRLLALVARTPHLDWLLLTKRPEGWEDRLYEVVREYHESRAHPRYPAGDELASYWLDGDAPGNVWLGVSVEDQRRADERVPVLLDTPAAVRFLSVEPMLGPVDLDPFLCPGVDWVIVGGESGQGGAKARPFDLAWARSVLRQCREAGVACFVKQLGSCASDPANGLAGRSLEVPAEAAPLISRRLRDGHGGDWDEWPADLRVREFPAPVRKGGG